VFQPVFFFRREPALCLNQVLFFMLEFRVGEPVGEVAVIGEEEQAGGIYIQTARRIKPKFFVLPGQDVEDGAPALFVAHGGDDAGRFIEHQADRFFRGKLHRLSVNRNAVAPGIYWLIE